MFLATCESCGIKFNPATRPKCAICKPTKMSNSPSSQKNRKRHEQYLKEEADRNEMKADNFTIHKQNRKFDYYAKGKRK